MNSFVAVVVLYRCTQSASVGLQTLLLAAKACDDADVTILVWDNSPDSDRDVHPSDTFSTDRSNVRILNSFHPDNPGLSVAYNGAHSLARDCGAEWLITLDQDTALPITFFETLFSCLGSNEFTNVAAIAPRVLEGTTICSPVRFVMGVPLGWFPVRRFGVSRRPISAINSGLAVRRSFLDSIGGYSTAYRIDGVDHWLCRTIYQHGQTILVVDVELQHELSVNRLSERVSLGRYESILSSQRQFLLTDRRRFPRWIASVLMPLHALKVLIRVRDKRFFRVAVREWILVLAGRLPS